MENFQVNVKVLAATGLNKSLERLAHTLEDEITKLDYPGGGVNLQYILEVDGTQFQSEKFKLKAQPPLPHGSKRGSVSIDGGNPSSNNNNSKRSESIDGCSTSLGSVSEDNRSSISANSKESKSPSFTRRLSQSLRRSFKGKRKSQSGAPGEEKSEYTYGPPLSNSQDYAALTSEFEFKVIAQVPARKNSDQSQSADDECDKDAPTEEGARSSKGNGKIKIQGWLYAEFPILSSDSGKGASSAPGVRGRKSNSKRVCAADFLKIVDLVQELRICSPENQAHSFDSSSSAPTQGKKTSISWGNTQVCAPLLFRLPDEDCTSSNHSPNGSNVWGLSVINTNPHNRRLSGEAGPPSPRTERRRISEGGASLAPPTSSSPSTPRSSFSGPSPHPKNISSLFKKGLGLLPFSHTSETSQDMTDSSSSAFLPDPEIIMDLSFFRVPTPANSVLSPDDFTIVKVLGKGFFGKVMLVQRSGGSGYYALKAMHKKFIKEQRDKGIQRALAELKILRTVNHPFIVNFKTSFHTPEKIYFLMDCAYGGDLLTLLQRLAPLPLSSVAFYSSQVLLALEYLHSNKIIYRDLKTENILLDLNGYVKLADFGLAKMHVSQYGKNSFCGSIHYLSPEVVQNLSYSYEIDWWALGVLLFELAHGFPPFYDENNNHIYWKIVNSPVNFPATFSPELRQIILPLLHKDPKQRLGAMGHDDIQKMKAMPFFAEIDFDLLSNRNCPTPYQPKVEQLEDASNFDPEFTHLKPVDSVSVAASILDDAAFQSQFRFFEGVSFNSPQRLGRARGRSNSDVGLPSSKNGDKTPGRGSLTNVSVLLQSMPLVMKPRHSLESKTRGSQGSFHGLKAASNLGRKSDSSVPGQTTTFPRGSSDPIPTSPLHTCSSVSPKKTDSLCSSRSPSTRPPTGTHFNSADSGGFLTAEPAHFSLGQLQRSLERLQDDDETLPEINCLSFDSDASFGGPPTKHRFASDDEQDWQGISSRPTLIADQLMAELGDFSSPETPDHYIGREISETELPTPIVESTSNVSPYRAVKGKDMASLFGTHSLNNSYYHDIDISLVSNKLDCTFESVLNDSSHGVLEVGTPPNNCIRSLESLSPTRYSNDSHQYQYTEV